MDAIMNKAGSYWLGQKANKEMSSAGDDIEVRAWDTVRSLLCSSVFVFRTAAGRAMRYSDSVSVD